jgi:hypothetical protein
MRPRLIALGLSLSLAAVAQVRFQHRSAANGAVPFDEASHRNLVRKSIMITDLAVVNHPQKTYDRGRAAGAGNPSGEWNLESVLTGALRKADPSGDPLVKLEAWKRALRSDTFVSGRKHLPASEFPFRLLAIANRLDLGRVGCPNEFRTVTDPDSVCGAEVRMIYGLSSGKGYHIIVEFILPKIANKDFVRLVQRWLGLAGKDRDEYLQSLTQMLADAQAESIGARVRINAKPFSQGPWDLREYRINEFGITLDNADREVGILYGPGGKGNSTDLVNFVQQNTAAIAASRYRLVGNLKVDLAQTSRAPFTRALTLFQVPANPSQRESLRHILSLNSCTGCHGLESNTEFQHISDRSPNDEAKLSPFLTGGSNPTFPPYHPVKPALKSGATAETYKYNDLLRRHQYLRSVVDWQPGWSGTRFLEYLKPFAAAEVH